MLCLARKVDQAGCPQCTEQTAQALMSGSAWVPWCAIILVRCLLSSLGSHINGLACQPIGSHICGLGHV